MEPIRATPSNDGQVRAHALQIAPGIVANKTTDLAPYLVFKQRPAQAP